MRTELRPLGIEWFDRNLGGIPARSTTLVYGPPKSGKTCLAVGFALASLERGPTCIVTTEAPTALLELAEGYFERDLHACVRANQLTLLRYSPSFESELSLTGGVGGPMAELRELLHRRKIHAVVFDTFDPALSRLEASNAEPFTRGVIALLGDLGVTVLCTARFDGRRASAGVKELAAHAAGSLELRYDPSGRVLRVCSASWCDVRNLDLRIDFVQRRGIVVRDDVSLHAPERAKVPRDYIATFDGALPPSEPVTSAQATRPQVSRAAAVDANPKPPRRPQFRIEEPTYVNLPPSSPRSTNTVVGTKAPARAVTMALVARAVSAPREQMTSASALALAATQATGQTGEQASSTSTQTVDAAGIATDAPETLRNPARVLQPSQAVAPLRTTAYEPLASPCPGTGRSEPPTTAVPPTPRALAQSGPSRPPPPTTSGAAAPPGPPPSNPAETVRGLPDLPYRS